MKLKKRINKKSELVDKDFLQIINSFKSKGTVIDDRGRNLIKTFSIDEKIINVKSFKIPIAINQFIYKYIRNSKAKRSFEYGLKLISKNILTPKPLAYYEYFSPLGLQQSYYFSEHLKYDLTYRELVKNPNYPDHENILRQFTRFTWRLHEKGIYFKDHTPGNTLIVKKGDNYNFYLVDLNRMDFFKLDFDARIKNFSRLTPKKEMVKVMSNEYAKLVGESFEEIYEKMWFETDKFQKKFFRKVHLKEKYLGKKTVY